MSRPRSIIIDDRFNGPPTSANGGYACGAAAQVLTDGPAEVRLRRPPPLGVELEVVTTAEGVELVHDGEVVAGVRAWDGTVEAPPPPNQAALDAAVAGFDVDTYAEHHVFDRCYTCGPARAEGDGLRIFPAVVEGRGMVAWPWVPAPSTAGDDGLVDPRVVWAALDCPSGFAWLAGPNAAVDGAFVLGQLSARIDRRPAIGEDLVAGGWWIAGEGRKLFAGSAVWTSDGEPLARALATWFTLDAEQAQAFGARL